MTTAEVTSPLLLLFAVVLCCLVSSAYPSTGVGCRDNSGKPVDWFVVYKLPKLNSTDALVSRGVGQVYMDPENQKNWKLHDRGIDGADHAVAKTLQQIYADEDGNKEMPAYILYNDKSPKQENYTSVYGHTKGALAFDRTSGFWLVHSVPGFPPSPKDSAYAYPVSGLKYGQVFLCVSLKYEHFNKIGEALLYNYPQVYDFHLPQDLAKDNPALVNVTKMVHVTKKPWKQHSFMTSLGGRKFLVFAKASEYGKDLYHDLVAPYLGNDLLVETWQNPPGERMPSNCSAGQPKVFNAKEMEILSFGFKSSLDHAKWATTLRKTMGGNWICIGDINRMVAQQWRGGGTVCGKLPPVAWVFRLSAIVGKEECKMATDD